MTFSLILAAVYLIGGGWYLYRSGYEAGRAYELDRELQRLKANREQIDEEYRQLNERLSRKAQARD